MASQVVLGISIGLIAIFALLFWRLTRAAPGPTALRFKNGMKSIFDHGSATGGDVKNLNAVFMYNEHSFDAYEVLGIPAGSNMAVVQKAYKEALDKKTAEREFIETAYQAILTSQKK
jgi:hypothetical protein